MKKLLFLTLALLLIPGAAFAAVANDSVYVAPTETINDNFVRAGNTITIDGTVNGDVIVAGNTITINGAVSGDVLALAASVTVNGNVGGNVRAAGGTVTINGSVGRNTTVAGGTITTGKDAVTGWSFAAAGGTLQMNGEVKGNVTLYGGSVTLANTIGTDATVYLDPEGTITVFPSAVITRDLTYTSTKAADVQTGATIGGQTIHKLQSQTVGKAQEFLDISWIFGRLIGLFATLFVGVIIVSLFPGWVTKTTALMQTRPGMTVLVGIITLIVTPIVTLILLFSIIGIPLALILSALYFILLYSAKVFLGAFVGTWIMKLMRKQNAPVKEPSLFWPMMLGTTIVAIVSTIPILGGIIQFIGVLWAFGAFIMIVRQNMAVRA